MARVVGSNSAFVVLLSPVLLSLLLLLTIGPLSAQWLHYPTPGIPRTPDGKANLSAPAPKTADGKPDLSGIWAATDPKYFQDLGASGVEIPTLPWAEALRLQDLINSFCWFDRLHAVAD
jgi:hypothetical protein